MCTTISNENIINVGGISSLKDISINKAQCQPNIPIETYEWVRKSMGLTKVITIIVAMDKQVIKIYISHRCMYVTH